MLCSVRLQACAVGCFAIFQDISLLNYEALPGGSPMSPVWILKRLVLVFLNACRLLSALLSLWQFGRGRLSLVTISFYALLLLFGPCRLSEFTLAGPQLSQLNVQVNATSQGFNTRSTREKGTNFRI